MQWQKPITDMVNHRGKYLLHFSYFSEEDDEMKSDIGIFTFDGIHNIFKNQSGHGNISYKDIIAWLPIPKVSNRES